MLSFAELKNKSRIYKPAILLSDYMSHRTRKFWRWLSFYLMAISFILMLAAPHAQNVFWMTVLPADFANFLYENIFKVRSVFFIIFIVWFKNYLLEVYYLSYYFTKSKIDYEVAKLAIKSNKKDITLGFLESKIGDEIMHRLGIESNNVEEFIKQTNRHKVNATDLTFDFNALNLFYEDKKTINLTDYIFTLYQADQSLRDFLIRNHINETDFIGAVSWVQNMAWSMRQREQFWSRENLARIPSLGRLLFAEDFKNIEKYCHLISENEIYHSLGKDWYIFEEEALKLEEYLLDQTYENVVIMSDQIESGMQVVSAFGKMILEGKSLHKFENKKIYVLNPEVLLLNNNDKEKFETVFLELLEQASHLNDVIMVIPNLSLLIESLDNLGLDVVKFLHKILNTKNVPFITLATKEDYYSVIEPNYKLGQYFDKFVLPEIDQNFIIRVLQNEASRIEKKDGKIITFPVISKIAEKNLTKPDSIQSSLVDLHRIYQ